MIHLSKAATAGFWGVIAVILTGLLIGSVALAEHVDQCIDCSSGECREEPCHPEKTIEGATSIGNKTISYEETCYAKMAAAIKAMSPHLGWMIREPEIVMDYDTDRDINSLAEAVKQWKAVKQECWRD